MIQHLVGEHEIEIVASSDYDTEDDPAKGSYFPIALTWNADRNEPEDRHESVNDKPWPVELETIFLEVRTNTDDGCSKQSKCSKSVDTTVEWQT